MTHVGVHEAKTKLSELLRRVAAGEEVVITRRGEEVARLVGPKRHEIRVFGQDRGRFTVPEDFDDALPEEVLGEFEDA